MKTSPFVTVRASRQLTEIEFCAWVAQAAPGDRLEYHRGFLALDTVSLGTHLPEWERAELVRLARRAWAKSPGARCIWPRLATTDGSASAKASRPGSQS